MSCNDSFDEAVAEPAINSQLAWAPADVAAAQSRDGALALCQSPVPLFLCPAESPARENVTLLIFSCSAVSMQVPKESCAVRVELE